MSRKPARLWLRHLPAAVMVAGLAACSGTEVKPPAEAPVMKAPPPRPPQLAKPPVETAKSAAVRTYFAGIQRNRLAQGLLRTDGGGQDTPYTARMLAENFLRIAMFDEYSSLGGSMVRREEPAQLRRWTSPVRLSLVFGDSVSMERRATDKARVASYLARLAKLTGHPISLVEAEANFTLFVVSEDEREALGPAMDRVMPGLSGADRQMMLALPLTNLCMVYAQSDGNSGQHIRAMGVVRAEHSDLLRQSCFHEEIAQGLGLSNDSPRARPSIFNDDDEFAFLTTQDELMLTMLYSPELRPGMKLAEVEPIATALARRLMGPDS